MKDVSERQTRHWPELKALWLFDYVRSIDLRNEQSKVKSEVDRILINNQDS